MPNFSFRLDFETEFGPLRFRWGFPFFERDDNREPAVTVSPDGVTQELVEALKRDGDTWKKIQAGGEAKHDFFLQRWLESKRGDVGETVKALRSHASWRCSFVPRGLILESEIREELAAHKVFLQGCNDQGHALLIVLARRHDMNVRDFRQTEKLIVYTLDAASALADLGGGEMVSLGLMLKNLDVKVLTAIFELLQKHYPERLGMLWFINAPFIFWAVWRVVSPLIEECSRQKIKFVSSHEHRCSTLLQDSASAVLPHCYGGEAQMIPIECASQQIFRQGITHPSQLTAETSASYNEEGKETWRMWLKRHRRLTLIVNWVSYSSKSVLNNRFNRYIWTKTKRIVWRAREEVHIIVPPSLTRRSQDQRFQYLQDSENRPLSLLSIILILVLLNAVLFLLTKFRAWVLHSIWLGA